MILFRCPRHCPTIPQIRLLQEVLLQTDFRFLPTSSCCPWIPTRFRRRLICTPLIILHRAYCHQSLPRESRRLLPPPHRRRRLQTNHRHHCISSRTKEGPRVRNRQEILMPPPKSRPVLLVPDLHRPVRATRELN